MVEFINNKVSILPQCKFFFKEVNKKDIEDLLNYLYYYYDEESPYALLLPEERKQLCLSEWCQKIDMSKYTIFITKYEDFILTPVKRLATSMNRRIEKIIKEIDNSDIDVTDLEKEGKNMKALTEIFKLQDVLNEKIAKESNVKEGKGSKKVSPFETSTFDDI